MYLLSGTAAVTNGSPTVTFTSGALVNQVFEGDAIGFTSGGSGTTVSIDKLYRVSVSPSGDVTLTLETNFAETTASGLKVWLLPHSLLRQNTLAVSAQMTDFVQRYNGVILAAGSDRRVTLNKTLSTDYSEVVFGQGNTDYWKIGMPADNEWHLQAKINSGVWTDIMKTTTTGSAPNQVVALTFSTTTLLGIGGTPTYTGDFQGSGSTISAFDTRAYASGQGGGIKLDAYNAAGTPARKTWGLIVGYGTTGTGGSEVADMVFSTMKAGTLTEALRLLGSGVAQFAFGATIAGALAVTAASANALAVGRLGTTTPGLVVDASVSSCITGWKITPRATTAGVDLTAIGETNVNARIDAAGSGTLTLNGTATGAITLSRATTISAALTYGGVTLSSAVTGTGNMVLSASPTLTGTLTVPTIAASSGISLSGGSTAFAVDVAATLICTLRNSAVTDGNVVDMRLGKANNTNQEAIIRFKYIAAGGSQLSFQDFINGAMLTMTHGGGVMVGIGLTDQGAGSINLGANLYRSGTQVVAARVTGYTAMTGSPDKATAYATSTVTLAQLAGRVAQMQADLTTHGLIGA